MAAPQRIEDQVKWRFTRCLNDFVIKSVANTAFCILAAKLFLNKAPVSTAMVAGTGIAIGMSYNNCEREMQHALTTQCKKGEVREKAKEEIPCEELEDLFKKDDDNKEG